MGKLVLLIDDDRLPMQYYVRAIQDGGFEVCQCTEPDSALETLASKGPEITAIILDVMMPPGRAYEGADTNEGLKTGVFLLGTIKDRWPDVPVIVLTNVRNPTTLSDCRARLRPCDYLLRKVECPPFRLLEILKAALDEKAKAEANR